MPRSLLEDAFAHNTWATMRLIEACGALSAEQLATDVPGTDRSILRTLQHIVGSDSFDLYVATRERVPFVNPDRMTLEELRAAAEVNGAEWGQLLAAGPDPDDAPREVDPDDGFTRDAPLGIRLAGVLHHGTDHRTQICTALTLLGVEPPKIDVSTFGVETGRSVEGWPDQP